MSRRSASVALALSLLALLVLAVSLLPVPYVRLAPGSTYNTLGTVNGVPLISITDTTTYPTTGHLDLTTVNESGGPIGTLTLGDALRGWGDPSMRVLPREVLFPEDPSPDEVKQDQTVAFDSSESSAIAASMRYLDRPLRSEVRVASVTPGSPSDGVIAVGDVIESVDGQQVASSSDVGRLVRSQPIGTALAIGLRSPEGQSRTATVTTAPREEDPSLPFIGVLTITEYRADFPITFGLTGVGGPSAGLMLTLGIIDKLTPAELTGGRFVAGTGTIDPEGQVGAIGGLEQKMAGALEAGAELFLAPRENCQAVVTSRPEGLTVVPVDTVAQAVDAIEDWRAGRPLPSCVA